MKPAGRQTLFQISNRNVFSFFETLGVMYTALLDILAYAGVLA
jgi:hypothetical protein